MDELRNALEGDMDDEFYQELHAAMLASLQDSNERENEKKKDEEKHDDVDYDCLFGNIPTSIIQLTCTIQRFHLVNELLRFIQCSKHIFRFKAIRELFPIG